MKKTVVLLIIILFCWKAYKVYNYNGNPYWGEYESPENDVTLLLKRNNKCVLVGKEYKDTFYEYGKYDIKNNELKIYFDKNDYGTSYLKGMFEGSSIKIFNRAEKESDIYYKE